VRKWIALHFETPIARAWIRKNIATSAGQYNISQTSLMRMPIPVPPESEMRVALEDFAVLELAREDTAAEAQHADRATPSIRQSILKAAFEGRLVAHDPRDESAERLLEKLSERAEADTPRRTRPKRRKVLVAES